MQEREQSGYVSYQLDGDNLIVAVGGEWNRFALENGAPSCVSEQVCGRPLHSFVSGDESRMWVSAILMLARASERTVEREYRCDSPEARRYMLMRVYPKPDRSLEVVHSLIRCEPRRIRVEIIPSERQNSSRRCSICGRLQSKIRWVEPEEVLPPKSIVPFKVNYGVCGDCAIHRPALVVKEEVT